MHRSKKKRNIIIFSLVGVLLCMVVGYAAFQTQLKVSGTSKVTSNWDIEITNVTPGTPTGSAENAVAPSYDKLWASMEANLYDKGDAMEYDVTIENKGTLDAKLNDIITNLDNSNNEAVIITFSGYTKGEVLKSKTSKVIHVKIEYNPEYEGGETSSEVEINFDYGQNNNEENNPDNQYLLTYDYSTNGGTSVELTEELIASGNNVDLSNTATKEGWNFVGWNTDKDAQIGLENYQMPASNTTLYAIYSKTLKVTYEKGDSVESIGKNEDSCNIYNNGTSCEITLPEITVTDDSATVGWYEGNNKVGEPNDKYTITNDITLRAEAQFEPIIQSWSSSSTTDFHNSTYRENIITATFLDNKDVPDNAVASWDVSANDNGSVMAWVIADETDPTKYHLYIGGDGGVIANNNSSNLFQNFTNLQTITFGDNFDTSNVTTMYSMFRDCSSLTTLDVSNWDTSKVTNMQYMFVNCSSLTTLNVSKWDTSSVIDMSSMFSGCSSLTELDVSKWDTNNVRNMWSMFQGCSSLTTLDVSNWDTSKVTSMNGMFSNCSSLTTIDVSNWNTSKVTSMNSMFYGCSSLTTLDVSKWDTSNVTNMGAMFRSCSSLTTIDVSNWNTSKVTSMNSMFYGCSSLTTLDVSKWDTSNVTNMGAMFRSCSSLTTIDVSNWNTSKVTSMYYMFYNCSHLITLDVSNWDTSKVTNMGGMFYYCSSLTTLDISKWDTSKVTNMSQMFSNCSSLTTLDVSNWNTSNVTNMNAMFWYSINLTEINLGNWNTSNVTNMGSMFSRCSSLTKLVLCNWNTSKVTGMDSMFYNTSNLNSIYVGPNWATANATTDNMFSGSGVSSVTQSDNCEIDAEEISLEISTTSTTNSITVVANAKADSGIAKYEYSKDGGKTWEESTNNTYTFTGLTTGTAYDIKVRVTSNIGKTLEKGIGVDITNNVVTTGDGLYEDEYEDGRYVYKGKSPNNYISFNNELWRILSVESDGSLKIIRDNYIGDMTFDTSGGTYGNNNWDRPADIKTYLNNDYFSTITTNKDQVASHTWSIGKVENANTDLAGQINDENSVKSEKANIGLITASEYLRANTNKTQCGNLSLNNTNRSTCKNTNWIYSLISPSNFLWTISPSSSSDDSVVSIYALITYAGYINNNYASNSYGILPALYLTQQTKIISGEGSQTNPYLIGNGISTSTLEKPTFKETETDNGKTVTINYPEGCGSSLTCTYQKDNGSIVNVTSATIDVEFTDSGSLVANVSDGTNSVSSSYTVTVLPYTPGPATNVITELLSKKPEELYTDDHDNIRYYGAEPNNYVYYNCTNVNNQTSDTCELWRIMGIIDGKVKIIKDETLTTVTTDNGVTIGISKGFFWNKVQQSGKNYNNWEDSTLQTYLNGTYYNSLNSTYRNMISPSTYYLGGATSSNYQTLTASGYYNAERDSTQVYSGNPANTTQNIGLMYPSDYGYAAGESCLSTALNSYNHSCKNTDYLFIGKTEWLQAPCASDSNLAAYQYVSGYVNIVGVYYYTGAVRPVLYLNTNVQITDGIGSQSNPFKLK